MSKPRPEHKWSSRGMASNIDPTELLRIEDEHKARLYEDMEEQFFGDNLAEMAGELTEACKAKDPAPIFGPIAGRILWAIIYLWPYVFLFGGLLICFLMGWMTFGD